MASRIQIQIKANVTLAFACPLEGVVMSKWVKHMDKPNLRYTETLWFSYWEECFLQIPKYIFKTAQLFSVRKKR